jgi:hypothetical protein
VNSYKRSVLPNSIDKYLRCEHGLEAVTGNKNHSSIIRLAGTGTGHINVKMLTNPVLARYQLDYLGGSTGWRLRRVISGVSVTIGDTGPVDPITNLWTIEDVDKIRVAIANNGTFSLLSRFTFQTINESFINILN